MRQRGRARHGVVGHGEATQGKVAACWVEYLSKRNVRSGSTPGIISPVEARRDLARQVKVLTQ